MLMKKHNALKQNIKNYGYWIVVVVITPYINIIKHCSLYSQLVASRQLHKTVNKHDTWRSIRAGRERI